MTNRLAERFKHKFAAGQQRHAFSGVWTVFSGRNRPDLYLVAGPLGGQIKASLHCPYAEKPTWKRHFRFVPNARGEVADAVRADGRIREEHSWRGAKVGDSFSVEWRIFVWTTMIHVGLALPIPVFL